MSVADPLYSQLQEIRVRQRKFLSLEKAAFNLKDLEPAECNQVSLKNGIDFWILKQNDTTGSL